MNYVHPDMIRHMADYDRMIGFVAMMEDTNRLGPAQFQPDCVAKSFATQIVAECFGLALETVARDIAAYRRQQARKDLDKIIALLARHGIEGTAHPHGYVIAPSIGHQVNKECHGFFEEVAHLRTLEETRMWLGY